MNIEAYKKRHEELKKAEPQFRQLCFQCMQPSFSCYCEHIRKFDPKIKFVILIHPIEMRRRIATGRMSHLSLENSQMVMGQDYSYDQQVNDIIDDPQNQCMVLYPGSTSINLSTLEKSDRSNLFYQNKAPVIFVIDGTWATAKKTMYLSQNLKRLPRLSFNLPHQSRFRVRKQPNAECFSTIEAIHHLIDLLGSRPGFDAEQNAHSSLIYVFNQMVEKQLKFMKKAYRLPRYKRDNPHPTSRSV